MKVGKYERKDTWIPLNAPVIECPCCGMTYSIFYYSRENEILQEECPNGESYCPYCGKDVVKNKEEK